MNLIGEIGINHNGSLDITKRLIDLALLSGFDYVKFQKREPSVCVPDHMKDKKKNTPWGEMTYLQYKKRIEFKMKEYTLIDRYINKRNEEYGSNLKWFASVWDFESAEFMKQFTNMVKIPSALITNIPLIKYCRENFEILLMSTGMSTESEIEKAVKIGMPQVLFHTNSCYPSPIEDLNLNYIKTLQSKFTAETGYSGHEWGLSTTYACVGLGINWIERHITLDHDMWGSDQKSSVDPVGCFKFVRTVKDIEKAMGSGGDRVVYESEKAKKDSLRV